MKGKQVANVLTGPKRSVGSVASLAIMISLLFPAHPVSLTYGLVFQPFFYLLKLVHSFGPKMPSVIKTILLAST